VREWADGRRQVRDAGRGRHRNVRAQVKRRPDAIDVRIGEAAGASPTWSALAAVW